MPPAPQRQGPDPQWYQTHKDLYNGVKVALLALADGFDADISIAGTDATDLFGLNSALGSAIERHVVEALNKLRGLWDPKGLYTTYTFVRFPQSFPDVRLVDRTPGSQSPVLMGIELKGWFALSKEKEPSFRFDATPLACNMQDLIVVVPWVFTNVLSGKPRLLAPFIEEARYAAYTRNHHWTWIRGKGTANDQVVLSTHVGAYPAKTDASSDKPFLDKGKNFGRLARTTILDAFTKATLENEAAGIPIKYWVDFLSAFTESSATTERKVAALAASIRAAAKDKTIPDAKVEALTNALLDLLIRDSDH